MVQIPSEGFRPKTSNRGAIIHHISAAGSPTFVPRLWLPIPASVQETDGWCHAIPPSTSRHANVIPTPLSSPLPCPPPPPGGPAPGSGLSLARSAPRRGASRALRGLRTSDSNLVLYEDL